MPQVSGADATFNFYEEDTFGQDPSVPSAVKLYLSSLGLKGTRSQSQSKILPMGSGNRTEKPPVRSKLDVGGPMGTELNGQSLGFLLKHTFGTVTTYRPASNTTATITGVTVEHADKTCPVGNGTLAFTKATNLLTWTANGDTAGTGVDVSAGGSFILESGTPSQALYVTVTFASLPAADASDTISVVSAYKNRFTFGSLPIGFTMEKDFGSVLAGVGRFVRYNGCRVDKMAFTLGTDGAMDVSVDIIGANKQTASAALDATPTDYGHTSFDAGDISLVEEGGASFGVGTDIKISISNNLDGNQYTLLGGGKRASIPEGPASVSAEYTALLEDLTLLNKMQAGTASSLKAAYALGDGLGTAGNESIVFDLNPISYEEDDPPIQGPGGVVISPKAMAYNGAMTIDLFNAIDHSI